MKNSYLLIGLSVTAAYAMDQVNADAFQEAYKDLVNLYFGVTQR